MTKNCDAEETSDVEILTRKIQTKKNYDKENSDEEISGGENQNFFAYIKNGKYYQKHKLLEYMRKYHLLHKK